MRRLNRAQRRRINNGKVLTDEVEEILQSVATEAATEAWEAYSTSVALMLNDKLGLDRDKIVEFMTNVDALFCSIKEGRLTIADAKATLKEELDIVIELI